MGRLARLLSFKGRPSRLAYWRLQLVFVLLLALFWSGGLLLADLTKVGAWGAIALVGCAPVYWLSLALAFRRLHDRGRSAWWIVLFQFAPVLLMTAIESQPGQDGNPFAALMAVAAAALLLWGFVEIGLLRGTRGANRYGPDPVLAQAR